MRVPASRAGLAAAALSGAVAALYITLILQGDLGGQRGSRQALIACALLFLPACALAGAMRPTSNVGVGYLAIAAIGLTFMGTVGFFSIGFSLLVAAALAWGALYRSARGRVV